MGNVGFSSQARHANTLQHPANYQRNLMRILCGSEESQDLIRLIYWVNSMLIVLFIAKEDQ